MAQVFFIIPHYTISFPVLPSCPMTAGLWTVWNRRFADLVKDNQQAEILAITQPCLFLLSWFAGSPTDAKPQTHCLVGVARRGCASRYAAPCESGWAILVVGLAYLARCHARLHDSARLWSLHSPLASSKSSSLTWSPLAITLGLSRCSYRPQTRQSFSWLPQLRIASCVNTSSVKRSSSACFSAQLIIILLIGRDFRNTCTITRRFWP